MSTPPTDSMIHRAKVQYSNSATGEIQAIIPSVTSQTGVVPVTMWGREIHAANSKWLVPDVGDTIVVCREDEDYTNVFWINTTVPPAPPYTFDDNLSTTFGNVFHIDVTTPSWGGTGGKIGLNTTSPTFPVQMAGATAELGNTLYIEETSFVGSSVAAFYLGQWVRVGAGDSANVRGNFYVQDKDANKYILYHTGHSNTTTGGLTIKATGLSERYLNLQPAYVSGTSEYSAIFGDNANAWMLINRGVYTYNHLPYTDNNYDLGWNSGGTTIRWQDIHLVNSPSVTSDQNEKTDIADSDLGLGFINALRPVSFKWRDRGGGEAGVRTHYGLLGQEVEAVLGAAASDTALWMTTHVDAKDAVPADEYLPGQPAVEEHDIQGLRYTELISPMIKAIQELTTRLEALESA